MVAYDPGDGSHPVITGIALQPNGDIVAVSCGLLARYLPNGSPDSTFGAGGYVQLGGSRCGGAVALQPNGKIVVAGAYFDGTDDEFMVTRYNPDGSPDTSFGTNGVTTTDPPSPPDTYSGTWVEVRAVAVLPNGKIVAAGSEQGEDNSTFGIRSVFALVQYTAAGSLDRTFNSGGIAETDFGDGHDRLGGIAVLPSGKIVATGAGYGLGHGLEVDTMVLARYLPSGSLDRSFGTHGRTRTRFTQFHDGGPPAVLNGKILVAGTDLARFTANGHLDTTFGKSGFAPICAGGCGRGFMPSLVVTRSNGKILIASPYTVARFLRTGKRDKSFGAGGMVALSDQAASSLVAQADGKLLVGGGTGSSWTLTRLIGG